MRHFCTVALLALVLPQLAGAAGPTIFRIDGAEKIRVVREGKKLWARAGEAVEYGDRVRTAEGQRATVAYPDGSQLVLLPSSEIEIVPQDADGSQPQRLIKGAVRGVVVKSPPGGPSGTKVPLHRFTIRSRAAVMGVRGTDFVMTLLQKGANATVHVLEGTVDVAGNEAALASGQATPVEAGNFVQAGAQGVGAPQPFDPASFLKDQGFGEGDMTAQAPEPSAMPSAAPSAKPEEKAAASEEKNESPPPTRSFRPLGFRIGMLNAGKSNGREMSGLNIAWSPSVRIPGTTQAWIRGHLGFSRIQDPTSNHYDMSIPEVGGLLSLQPLNRLLFEAGMLFQSWPVFNTEGPTLTLNVGLLPMPTGFLHSIYVGKTYYQQGAIKLNEWRAGIGIQF